MPSATENSFKMRTFTIFSFKLVANIFLNIRAMFRSNYVGIMTYPA